MINREKLKDWSYLIGSLICQAGGVTQIMKIHQTQSVNDLSFWWLLALIITAIMTFPRALSSPFWVWKVSRGTHMVVTTTMFISYMLYHIGG